jgi:hypothetical protein
VGRYLEMSDSKMIYLIQTKSVGADEWANEYVIRCTRDQAMSYVRDLNEAWNTIHFKFEEHVLREVEF